MLPSRLVLPLLLLLLAALPARAQDHTAHMKHTGEMRHASSVTPTVPSPIQPGQAAFAAIQEIEALLEADPSTDWSKVDLEALRRHLVDMNDVTLAAEVKAEAIDGGMRFVVTGTGRVVDAVRRMVTAHAAIMNGLGDWHFEAATVEAGAVLTVRVPAGDAAKLRGLGFIGVMTRGMHHQHHHLAMARGDNPHN